LERAIRVAVERGVLEHKSGLWTVKSIHGEHSYILDRRCRCKDAEKGNVCYHRLARMLVR
jgi:hypothetical protein